MPNTNKDKKKNYVLRGKTYSYPVCTDEEYEERLKKIAKWEEIEKEWVKKGIIRGHDIIV